MSEKRRGLGRGLGALIPTTTSPVTRPLADRPVDVFFPESQDSAAVSPMAETVGASAIPANLTVLPGGRGGSAANLQSSGVQATVPAPAVHAPSALVSPRTDPDEAPPTPAPEALQTDPARHAGDDAGAAAVQEGAAAASVAPSAVPASSGAVSSEPAPSDPARSVPAQSTPAQSTPEGAADQDTTAHGTTDRESVTAEGNDGGAGEGLVPVPGATFAELPVGAVCPNPRQPRQVFDEEELAELVHSIREVGVLQPVVVRRTAPVDGEARFELIMGERRLRAARDAGLERIPAIIRDTQDDALLRDALLENLHRSQLNPLEEAAAYQQLLDDFGCTHEELAASIGRSRPQISNTLRLLKLPALVQRRVAAGILSAGHARALLGLEDQAAMERLAQRTVAEGLSVRAVEEIVALGDGLPAKAAKRRPRAGSHTSELDDLASRLGDRLDTRVAIALGRTKGRLSIDFASVDDLNRIMGLLGPEVRGVFRG